jgi:hypothetical protein
MRTKRALLAGSLLAAILSSGCEVSQNDNNKGCAGLGCPSMPGTLTLLVLDRATQKPVGADLTFTTMARALPFYCSTPEDAGTVCPSWTLSYIGDFDVEVTAPGYKTGTIHVTIEGPAGCCGRGPDTSATLVLAPL